MNCPAYILFSWTKKGDEYTISEIVDHKGHESLPVSCKINIICYVQWHEQ